MKIAITSASGQLGRAILQEAINAVGSDNIIGIARSPQKLDTTNVEIRQGSYDLRKQMEDAFRSVDTVLMVSGSEAPEKRIPQHRNVIDAAKSAGVRKIVYTSIIGDSSGSKFSPIVDSNRQTEAYVKESGMDWVIGRNGLYMEPDVEFIDNYIREGKISNCAGNGACSYTTRGELAYAYVEMMLEDKHNDNTYNLTGDAITQQQLVDLINESFGCSLKFENIGVEEYRSSRIEELGEFLGTIIGGIYESINAGHFNVNSDYSVVAGREHISWAVYFSSLKKN